MSSCSARINFLDGADQTIRLLRQQLPPCSRSCLMVPDENARR